ncbi:MAG: hypothetical protein ACP6IY_14990 [Promethearchaeia archaeon]
MFTPVKKRIKVFSSALKKKELGFKLNIRDSSALETEEKIMEYLKSQKKEVSFYKLYTDLGFSSGKAQSALRRLFHDGYIVIKRKINKFKTYIWHKDFELDDVLELEKENIIIFPVSFDYTLGNILNQIPAVSEEYKNFAEVIQKALIYYFQDYISPEIKKKAVYKAVELGKISEKTAKELLGE